MTALNNFFVYLAVMAVVTYLIRMLPLVLVNKKIENKFIKSVLYYLPCSVLSIMTVPAIFYATDSKIAAGAGFLAAVIFAYKGKSLMQVAVISCIVVFIAQYLIKMTAF